MSDINPADLPVGGVFQGRYQVIRCIKAGGMGAVYEVLDQRNRRRRALKVMLPSTIADPDLKARFSLEATVAADVDSEHIVETTDAGVDPETGTPFLVMELLKGEELATMLARRGPLPPNEVITLLFQAALALDKTHAAGIVHRDLKPENLFITSRDDGSPRLKVLDFGIAKVVAEDHKLAPSTRPIGTPIYMAPEQVRGDGSIGPSADLFALGHIAFTLLTGLPYWDKERQKVAAVYGLIVVMMAGIKEQATVRAASYGVNLPPSFDAWFAKATALEPEARFERASSLVQALAAVFGVALRPHSLPEIGPSVAAAEPTPPRVEEPVESSFRPAPATPSSDASSARTGALIAAPSSVPNAVNGGTTTPVSRGLNPEGPSFEPASRARPKLSLQPATIAVVAVLISGIVGLVVWVGAESSKPTPVSAIVPGPPLSSPMVTVAPLSVSAIPSAIPSGPPAPTTVQSTTVPTPTTSAPPKRVQPASRQPHAPPGGFDRGSRE